jgi:hypothetical protein
LFFHGEQLSRVVGRNPAVDGRESAVLFVLSTSKLQTNFIPILGHGTL